MFLFFLWVSALLAPLVCPSNMLLYQKSDPKTTKTGEEIRKKPKDNREILGKFWPNNPFPPEGQGGGPGGGLNIFKVCVLSEPLNCHL